MKEFSGASVQRTPRHAVVLHDPAFMGRGAADPHGGCGRSFSALALSILGAKSISETRAHLRPQSIIAGSSSTVPVTDPTSPVAVRLREQFGRNGLGPGCAHMSPAPGAVRSQRTRSRMRSLESGSGDSQAEPVKVPASPEEVRFLPRSQPHGLGPCRHTGIGPPPAAVPVMVSETRLQLERAFLWP
jgi:hypothetical protein